MKKIILFLLMSCPFFVSAQQKEDVTVKPTSITVTPKPLYILDGNIVAEQEVTGKYKEKNSDRLVFPSNTLDPNEIERVEVLKGDSAISKYGEAGKNGVVIISTKAYLKKPKKL